MDDAMRSKIKDALLEISASEEGKQILTELFNMYGFVEATDADYEVIRTTAQVMNIDLEKQD
jgi:phosphonate transport system substrate-binding protein